jgi:hypothetical protein
VSAVFTARGHLVLLNGLYDAQREEGREGHGHVRLSFHLYVSL